MRMRRISWVLGVGLAALLMSSPAFAYTVYVTNQGENSISIIDGKAKKVLETVKISQVRPHNAVLSKDGSVVSTVPMPVWVEQRKRLTRTEDFHLIGSPSKRQRLCEGCNAPLEVSKEYTHAWTFSCPVCKSVEVHGKSQTGGTVGAGEVEKV